MKLTTESLDARQFFESFSRPSRKALAIIGLIALLAGCSQSSDKSDSENEPAAKDKAAAPLAPGAWKQHFEQAGEMFQEHKYHEMVRTLEATKSQAKSELGDTIQWGKYLTRLAKAHSWAIEYKESANNAKEAVQVFDRLKAPSVDKFAANWLAGISLAQLNKYDEAIPYLKNAQQLSKDPDAGVGDSLSFMYKNLEECYKHTKDDAALAEVSKEKRTRLRH